MTNGKSELQNFDWKKKLIEHQQEVMFTGLDIKQGLSTSKASFVHSFLSLVNYLTVDRNLLLTAKHKMTVKQV